ncbi:MAG TPA: L-threonylcarbamoyladenylate synthase [Mycobacteriales bacterium]|nr:L-threonylcarbamoyladenylate synthase [Mycobacteriales bacterium]
MTTYDCRTDLDTGVTAATDALKRGELAVLPTDTVYGVAADAFNPIAVGRLLEAKGRGRDMPTPVLVPSARTLEGLCDSVPQAARDLVEAFWPGALTLVLTHAVTLAWDLGETKGTVAVRMPLDRVTLTVLERTGPLAVSSANRSGMPPAVTAAEAEDQLGTSVDVYLDGGPAGDPVPSTIVDLTGETPKVLRLGALSVEELRGVVPGLIGPE